MFIQLSEAVSLLLTLALFQQFILRRWSEGERAGTLLSGILYGSICIIGMVLTIELTPGVIFDARSVILSMASLFGGPVVGGIAAGMAIFGRWWIGGNGAYVGTAIIVVSAVLGLAYRYGVKHGWLQINFPYLLAFGLIVNVSEAYLFTLMPNDATSKFVQNIALPFFIIFPPATALLGTMLKSIEDQIATTRSLIASEQRFRNIAEIAGDWIWETDAGLRFTYISQRFFDLFPLRPEDVIGYERGSISHTTVTGEGWRKYVNAIKLQSSFRNITYAIRLPNGETRHVRINGKPMVDRHGTFLGYHGTGTDETAHVSTTIRVTQSEARLDSILQTVPEAIIVMDSDLRVTHYNRGAYDIFGYSAKEMLGTPVDLLLPRESREIHRFHIENFAKSAETVRAMSERIDTCGLKRDGSTFPAEATVSKMTVGDEMFFVVALKDITNRKRDETLLKESRKAAILANRTKTEFMANMSHELRTPLNAIIGFSEVMDHQVFGPLQNDTYCDYVKSILNSGKHLLGIISDLLDVSIIESGHIELNENAVNLPEIIEFAVTTLAGRATMGNVQIVRNLAPDLPLLRADEIRIKQILLNILSNAVRFTERKGKVLITANIGIDDSITISVKDTGIGIPKSELKEITKPFARLGDSHVQNKEGTGLGLMIVETLVQLHGGQLDIDSNLGEGTVVTITFPPERTISLQPCQNALTYANVNPSTVGAHHVADE